MVGTHLELALSCITIMLIKESSLTAIVKFLATFGSREQNLKLEYRTKRTPDDKSYIWYGYDQYPWTKTNYITWSAAGFKMFFSEFLKEIYKMLLYKSLIDYQTLNPDKPYSECSTSSRHQFCDLMGAGKKIEILCQCHRDGFPRFNTTLR